MENTQLGSSALILCASMPKSGNSWLYHTTRTILCNAAPIAHDLACGTVEEMQNHTHAKFRLVNARHFDAALVEQAKIIFYSYSDIRDAIANLKQKFGTRPSLRAVNYFIGLHQQWTNVANYIMRYEDIQLNKAEIVAQLAQQLGVDCDTQTVLNQIEPLEQAFLHNPHEHPNEEELFLRNCVQDDIRDNWKIELDTAFIERLEKKYTKWLIDHNYPVEEDSNSLF